jgi:hypothetical protein
MFRNRFFAFAVVTAFPAGLLAQLKSPVPVSAPTASSVIKSIPVSGFTGLQGTTVTPASVNSICCGIARATGGGGPSVTIHFGDGSVHVPALQTGLGIAHDVPHSVTVALNGADIFGVQCDAKGSLKVSPNFVALGGSSAGFKWELRDAGKVTGAGRSVGSIAIDNGGQSADAMSFGITDHGVMTFYHGTHTLVIIPDATDIGSKTGGYLRFEDLGLRAGGVSEFTILSPSLVSDLQPPGSRQ